jgi:hypothetical protein
MTVGVAAPVDQPQAELVADHVDGCWTLAAAAFRPALARIAMSDPRTPTRIPSKERVCPS